MCILPSWTSSALYNNSTQSYQQIPVRHAILSPPTSPQRRSFALASVFFYPYSMPRVSAAPRCWSSRAPTPTWPWPTVRRRCMWPRPAATWRYCGSCSKTAAMLRLGTRYKQNRYAIYIFYNLTAFDPKFYVIYVSFCKVFKGVGFSCMKKVILNFL